MGSGVEAEALALGSEDREQLDRAVERAEPVQGSTGHGTTSTATSRCPAPTAHDGPGDVLIHRAVGSDGNRLVAVGEVRALPEPSGHERWPWQVRRRLVYVCRQVTDGPGIADIGQTVAGLRVFEKNDERSGSEAVRLLAERGQRLDDAPSTGDGASQS